MPLLRILLVSGLLASCTNLLAQIDAALIEALESADRAPVIVKFDFSDQATDGISGLDDESIQARISAQNAVLERALGRTVEDLSSADGTGSRLRRVYQSVALVSMLLTEDDINALLADPAVASVQLDEIVPPTSNVSIPLIGAAALHSAGLIGTGVSTAILDTGVDHEHPMFAGRIIDSVCFSSNVTGSFTSTSFCPGGVEVDTTTEDAGDDCAFNGDSETAVSGCGHGTHVAGIAAGGAFVDPVGGDTLIGVAPGADIVAVQVFSRFTSNCTDFGLSSPCTLTWASDQLAGLDWLFMNREVLNLASANMSLGGGRETSFCNSDSRFAVIDNLRNAGIATAISSGNNGFQDSVGAPGCIEPAITVGATTDGDAVVNFSNSATMVDLLAPGVGINSAAPTIDDTLPGRARSISGTSMAAPHVAGAFALLKAANPAASVTDIENALESTGVPVTESPSGLVKPRLQIDLAHAALDSTSPNVASIQRFNPTAELTNADALTWRVSFSEVVANLTADDFELLGTTAGLAIDNITADAADLIASGGDLASVSGEVSLTFSASQNIEDIVGNPLLDTTPTGADESYQLDNTPPVLLAIRRSAPEAEETDADGLTFELNFSEAVDNVSIDDFIVVGTTATALLNMVDAQTYELRLSGGDLPDLTGVVGLNVFAEQDITDVLGNTMSGGEPAIDETYSVVNTATIGGTVTGLVGTGLIIRNNASEQLSIENDGSFVFTIPVTTGEDYLVDVVAQPSTPSQTCTITNEQGPVIGPDIDDVLVACETNRYSVGGTVSGLLGSGLVLRNLGVDDLAVTANGTFVFDTPIESGEDYVVSVATDPTGPVQRCFVSDGDGMVDNSPIEDVTVDCRNVVDLAIAKTSSLEVLEPGAPVDYEIAVTNLSAVTVSGVRVVDTPPPALLNVSWACQAPAGSACPAAGSGEIDDLIDVGPGDTVVFTMVATTVADFRGVVVNMAEVTAPAGEIEDEVGNNSSSSQLATADIFGDRFEE